MSNPPVIPINFHGLTLEMIPHFFQEDIKKCKEKKIHYVDVTIYSAGEVLSKFRLDNQVEPINAEGIVEGEMYLDLSKVKIIFEGFYYEEGKQKPFWLEIAPDSNCFKDSVGTQFNNVNCPPYPASVGTLSFSIAPSAAAIAGTNDEEDSQLGVKFKMMQNESEGNIEEVQDVTYLLTTLYGDKPVMGVDTHNHGKHHEPDFAGNVGIIRNRVFIDGVLRKGDGAVYSDFYLEVGI